ncbi:agamous-like MADS-box protein AGL62 [Mangifera indica]|uniref:agamous-like MADS-box protein AGL62 n=1 Tax=Mangifera indica TaxID=29780 RepID=UPI001CFBDAD8|nr:agamous-like MADS-box protein AGL62 [Mangifera indica]
MATKKTRGRQKIEMKRIEKEEDRLITFSKRRSGIYKKASELVTLTGAEVGVMVFSPSGKAFSFGHPSIEAVANRFTGGQPLESDPIHRLLEARRKERIDELNQHYNDLLSQLEVENERHKLLKEMRSGRGTQGWIDTPIDQFNMEELHQMHGSLDKLEKNLLNKIYLKTGNDLGASSSLMAPSQNLDQARNPFPMNNPTEAGPSCSSFAQSYGGFHPNQF